MFQVRSWRQALHHHSFHTGGRSQQCWLSLRHFILDPHSRSFTSCSLVFARGYTSHFKPISFHLGSLPGFYTSHTYHVILPIPHHIITHFPLLPTSRCTVHVLTLKMYLTCSLKHIKHLLLYKPLDSSGWHTSPTAVGPDEAAYLSQIPVTSDKTPVGI